MKNQKQVCLDIIKEPIIKYNEVSPMPYGATHYSLGGRTYRWMKFKDGKWRFFNRAVYENGWRIQNERYDEDLNDEMVDLEKVGFHKHIKCDATSQ